MSPHHSPTSLVPELAPSAATEAVVRIPRLRSVPISSRVTAIIDHPAFQRLRRVRMLGPTCLVYPGAVHSRFEHSLGVYDYVRQFLLSLLTHPHFRDSATEEDLLTVLAAGLLHDIGHYPFAHSLEALHLKGEDCPRHEDVGAQIVNGEIQALRGDRTIGDILLKQWGVQPDRVMALCTGELGDAPTQMDRILHSLISGTVDADKMDYLERDSHHTGVPYGDTFDRRRLLANLTLNGDEDRLAIDAKGKIPAEMFVFARYTMFSELYWHHTVRSASAMVENAMAAFQSRGMIDPSLLLDALLRHDDDDLLEWLCSQTPTSSATHFLLRGLRPNRRALYKRIATYSRAYVEREKQQAYRRIYEMERPALSDLNARLTAQIASRIDRSLPPASLIIDIPPRDKDTLETIDIVYPQATGQRHYPLHTLSRVVAGIQDDFISVVKKIRIFVHPDVASSLRQVDDLQTLLLDEILR